MVLPFDTHVPVAEVTAMMDEQTKTLFEACRQAAKSGDSAAQFHLAWMYESGFGVEPNQDSALEWYRKSAEQGHAKAQYWLGSTCLARLYRRWRGIHPMVGISRDDAIAWLRKAAEQGHVEAQKALGGECQTQDAPAQAVEWYRKAAEQGDVEAQRILAYMFQDGLGIPIDTDQAIHWYHKAAEQGDCWSQFWLGTMLQTGEGASATADQAIQWYQKAAAQGLGEAQFALGMLYTDGHLTPPDRVQAHMWFSLASTGRNHENQEAAKIFRQQLELIMSPSEHAESQRLATEWKTLRM